jgi:hypothetical protein
VLLRANPGGVNARLASRERNAYRRCRPEFLPNSLTPDDHRGVADGDMKAVRFAVRANPTEQTCSA